MALGKAFIEVHADTKPFARELSRDLLRILEATEKDVRKVSRQVGETIAREAGNGVERNRKQLGSKVQAALTDSVNPSWFAKITKGIVDTLDDGLSGLPAEVKAVLGASLVAMLPIAVGLGSALAAGITAGLSLAGGFGVGALLAAQFEEVQDSALNAFSNIRQSWLEQAGVLVRPFINAIGMVESRFKLLAPAMGEIFTKIGETIVPITDALVGFVEEFIPGLSAGFSNLNRFLAPLQVGLRLIGQAAGNFFDTILSMEDAPAALYDLLIFVEDLIQAFTGLVRIGLATYGVLRDIAEALGIVEPYTEDINKFANEFGIASTQASNFGGAIEGTIVPLEAQSKAIEETNRLLEKLTGELFDSVQNEIDFERAMDELTKSVLENGRTLDIGTEAGRKNAEQLLKLAKIAIETRQTQIDLTGDVNSAQAAFEDQRTEIYNLAKQMGLSETKTEELIGAMLRIPPPKPSGITKGTIADLQKAIALATTLANKLGGIAVQGGIIGAQAYAKGGIVTQPHLGIVGEAGPEAIIPLNNPARAQQIMSQAGLANMASPTVNVYIGNQQIDAYIDDRVDRQMATTARSLAYGGRGI